MKKEGCSGDKKSYHHGNLREVLVESALDILKEGCLNDLSLRALARKAGVSQTAPYRHFEDKEALMVVVKAQGLSKLGAGMNELQIKEKDPVLRLQKLGMLYVQFAEEHPAHFKVMFEYELSSYEKYSELLEVSGSSFKCLQATVNECLALPNARKVIPAVAQFGAWSMVHGLSLLLMNESLMTHLKIDHELDMGERHQIVEQVTKLYCDFLVKQDI